MPASLVKLETMDNFGDSLLSPVPLMVAEADVDGNGRLDVERGHSGRRRILRIRGEYPSNRELMEMEKLTEVEDVATRKIIDQLQALSEVTNMPITQENGQRCFGPPRDWNVPAPPKGCEVFVGKLPRDVFEPHLVPLFSRMGRIYEMRIMMDFSGTNRGYCFVQYTRVGDAHTAIRELNEYEILPGRKIGVMKSVDNCRLFIGGIPKNKTEHEVFQEISRLTEGVRKVIVVPLPHNKAPNQGFAFVEYNCHKTAAMARRMLIPGNITLWGQDVAVDWAEPELENQITNLYIRNIDLSTSEEILKNICNEVSNNGVERVKKISDYAFIKFKSHEQADAAKMALDRTEVDGSQIKVYWGKQTVDTKAGRSTERTSMYGAAIASRNGTASAQEASRAFCSGIPSDFRRITPAVASGMGSEYGHSSSSCGYQPFINAQGYGNACIDQYFQNNGLMTTPQPMVGPGLISGPPYVRHPNSGIFPGVQAGQMYHQIPQNACSTPCPSPPFPFPPMVTHHFRS